MKIILTLVIIICSHSLANAQDWCAWEFQYDFRIQSNNKGNYHFDNLKMLITDQFQSAYLQKSILSHHDSLDTYSIKLVYGCVSCGHEGAKYPSGFNLYVNLYDSLLHQKRQVVVPVTFEKRNTAEKYFDLGVINYEDFMRIDSTDVNYEGIRVKSNNQIYKYTNGEYPAPQTTTYLQGKNIIQINGPCDVFVKANRVFEQQVGATFERTVKANCWAEIINPTCSNKISLASMIRSRFYLKQDRLFIKYKNGKPYNGRINETDEDYTIIGRCRKGFLTGKLIIKNRAEVIWEGIVATENGDSLSNPSIKQEIENFEKKTFGLPIDRELDSSAIYKCVLQNEKWTKFKKNGAATKRAKYFYKKVENTVDGNTLLKNEDLKIFKSFMIVSNDQEFEKMKNHTFKMYARQYIVGFNKSYLIIRRLYTVNTTNQMHTGETYIVEEYTYYERIDENDQ